MPNMRTKHNHIVWKIESFNVVTLGSFSNTCMCFPDACFGVCALTSCCLPTGITSGAKGSPPSCPFPIRIWAYPCTRRSAVCCRLQHLYDGLSCILTSSYCGYWLMRVVLYQRDREPNKCVCSLGDFSF